MVVLVLLGWLVQRFGGEATVLMAFEMGEIAMGSVRYRTIRRWTTVITLQSHHERMESCPSA